MLNNKLARNLLLAGVIGAGAFAATSAPAAADTYTRCDSYGCYRVHCDYDRDNCWREQNYITARTTTGRITTVILRRSPLGVRL